MSLVLYLFAKPALDSWSGEQLAYVRQKNGVCDKVLKVLFSFFGYDAFFVFSKSKEI
jgi:hypothetical protein